MSHKTLNKQGYSLVELLVGVGLVGFMIAGVIFFQGYIERTQVGARAQKNAEGQIGAVFSYLERTISSLVPDTTKCAPGGFYPFGFLLYKRISGDANWQSCDSTTAADCPNRALLQAHVAGATPTDADATSHLMHIYTECVHPTEYKGASSTLPGNTLNCSQACPAGTVPMVLVTRNNVDWPCGVNAAFNAGWEVVKTFPKVNITSTSFDQVYTDYAPKLGDVSAMSVCYHYRKVGGIIESLDVVVGAEYLMSSNAADKKIVGNKIQSRTFMLQKGYKAGLLEGN